MKHLKDLNQAELEEARFDFETGLFTDFVNKYDWDDFKGVGTADKILRDLGV